MSVSTLTDGESRESCELEQLEARLIALFSPLLRPEEVQRCVIDCVTSYESARVATRRLRDMRRDRLA